MAELDARPEPVAVKAYAGDTLTIEVTAPEALLGGRQWLAEIRADRTSEGPPDATFDITEPAVVDGPAYLVLPAAVTAGLLETAGVTRRRRLTTGGYAMVKSYSGQWDCQVSNAGTDPVTTLVQGDITIEADVSRPV